MANIDIDILESAYQDGAFKKPPNKEQNIYFRASIITAWEVIEIIGLRAELGIEQAAIAETMRMNYATIGYFLRWLVEKNLIDAETPKGDRDQPMQARIYRKSRTPPQADGV